ncbi:hypothetical protein Q1695_004356 [Nippostrongylus brasiliensis]|nr:hypothetical protein Q1695_004356 [Nippostrongylus brasiliensis]
MFVTPLFFSVAVLFVTDVAKTEAPQKFLVIANSTKNFSKLIEILHAVNAFAAILLDDVSGKPGREVVARADEFVEAALRKEQKAEILRRLARALKAEVRALLEDCALFYPVASVRCAYSDLLRPPFCIYVKWAGHYNNKTLELLERGDFAKSSTQRFTRVDTLVQELLTKKEHEELHSLLVAAQNAAHLGALDLAKAECNNPSEDAKEKICTEVFDYIERTIKKLVDASIELERDLKTDENEKKLRK